MDDKAITIDADAYDALCRHRKAGQSLSDVIKDHFGGNTTGAELAPVLAGLQLAETTLDEIERLIGARD